MKHGGPDIKIICSQCGAGYRVSEEFIGRKARCRMCGAILSVTSEARDHGLGMQSPERPKRSTTAQEAAAPLWQPSLPPIGSEHIDTRVPPQVVDITGLSVPGGGSQYKSPPTKSGLIKEQPADFSLQKTDRNEPASWWVSVSTSYRFPVILFTAVSGITVLISVVLLAAVLPFRTSSRDSRAREVRASQESPDRAEIWRLQEEVETLRAKLAERDLGRRLSERQPPEQVWSSHDDLFRISEDARRQQQIVEEAARKFEAERTASLRAWQEFQMIQKDLDSAIAEIANSTNSPADAFALIAEALRLAAARCVQMDLTQVDPLFANYVARHIAHLQSGAGLSTRISGELKQAEQLAAASAAIGGLLGAADAAARGQNPEAGMIAGGLAFGLVGSLGLAVAAEEIQKKYKPELDQWAQRNQALMAERGEIAKRLSEKYQTPFIDAF